MDREELALVGELVAAVFETPEELQTIKENLKESESFLGTHITSSGVQYAAIQDDASDYEFVEQKQSDYCEL